MGRKEVAQPVFGLVVAILLIGCSAAENESAANTQSHAGWYIEHAGQGIFQPCGQSQQWRVSDSGELRAKASKFGLEQDTPVYVRLSGVRSANGTELEVAGVEQFGSPTPVRDCALTGVVIPAPSSSGN